MLRAFELLLDEGVWMFDTFQVILWSITYVLIIVSAMLSRKEHKISMPFVAGVLNFSWEICALLHSRGHWGHVLWLSLDVAVILSSFLFIQSSRKRILYAVSILFSIVLLRLVFSLQGGMLISVFIIDFIMAIWYLVDRKRLSPKLKIPIAFTKLLGDLFAGIAYAPESIFVGILAILVFYCNIAYLCLCIEEMEKHRVQSVADAQVLL